MIGIIATLKAQDGKSVQFEQIFRQLAALVKANEPGVLVYQLARSRSEPNTYRVMEVYRDQATVDDHIATDYFKDLFGQLQALMSGPPGIEMVDPID